MALWHNIAFIPLWVLPNSFFWIGNGVFSMQSAVQGAWGVVSLASLLQLRNS